MASHHVNMIPERGHTEADTDTNIFALGDAASHLEEDLDDLFSGFGVNLTDILKEGAPGTITTTKVQVPQKAGKGQANGDDAKQKNTVSVSMISQKLDDGRSLHTRVVKGPVKCTKRMVKISREGPNGPEVIAEVEASPDADMNELLAAAIPKGLAASSSSVFADYDNLNPEFGRSREPTPDRPFPKKLNLLESEEGKQRDDQTTSAPEPPQSETESEASDTAKLLSLQTPQANARSPSCPNSVAFIPSPKPAVDKEPSLHNDTKANAASEPITSNHIFSRKQTRRISQSRSKTARRKSLAPLPDEDAIQLYQPPEKDDGSSDSEDSKSCHCCRGRKKRKKIFTEMKGKSSGMTSLHDSSNAGVLPGIKALVANYARMLYEERQAFVETLFRAVKLNNVDVTRILCKIVQKSGFKLSHYDLREPESSATILHVALLYNHVDIVKVLLNLNDRDLILAKYETAEYHNQTGLHVAVAQSNSELIESILLALEPQDRVVIINTIADGKYFKEQHANGQLCLTAAAWAGNIDVIRTLVRYGGQLGLKNMNGNTLLHALILQSVEFPDRCNYENLYDCVWDACGIQAEMMTILYDDVRYQQQRDLKQKELHKTSFMELMALRNNDGYTPLALATALASRLFEHIVNMEKIFKIPQNKLGSIAWVTYDVTDVSSFACDKYNKFSVLHILAHTSTGVSRKSNLEEMEDFLEMQPVKAILDCKWALYRWIYIFWMVVHVGYMVIFTACTARANSMPLDKRDDNGELIKAVIVPQMWLVVFMILPCVYLVLECVDLCGIKPYRISFLTGQNYIMKVCKCIKSEWSITGNGPYRLLNFGFSSFTLQWFILYMGKEDTQDIALAMSLLLGWVFVLFFTRACRVTCRFSIMIQKMFFRDLIYFLTVYGIVLIGFSFAMNALFTYLGDPEVTINKVFYKMMNVITDLDSKQTVDGSRHQMFAKLLLILYAIIAVILLMNMLIAMMNTSYETIRVTRCNLWKSQQLSILLMLERRFFWLKWLCRRSEKKMWRKEPGSGDSEDEGRTFIDVTMLHTPSNKTADT